MVVYLLTVHSKRTSCPWTESSQTVSQNPSSFKLFLVTVMKSLSNTQGKRVVEKGHPLRLRKAAGLILSRVTEGYQGDQVSQLPSKLWALLFANLYAT
jgi:hypothetical protein